MRDQIKVLGVRQLSQLNQRTIVGRQPLPKLAPQPLKEEYLLTGALEPTNRAYALAKIAGIEMCWSYNRQYGTKFLSAMPTNLYGPGDNFDLAASHVVPALIRKMDEARTAGARSVPIWGSGSPRREFLHVDDLADACVHLLRHYSAADPVNVGCGTDLTIAELAALVRDVVGFSGELAFDASKPDGTPRKLLDVGRLTALGWQPRIPLRQGLEQSWHWFQAHRDAWLDLRQGVAA